MPTIEGVRLKILKYDRLIFGNVHQKKLKNKKFTIISNNCWAGETYEYYKLQKQSPTIGCFFMADDYICFLKNLKAYLNAPLTFIKPSDSKWKEYPQVSGDKRFGTYPIGKLSLGHESIEIFFLHYHSEEEVRCKWIRRCQRIQWSNLLVKFNDQNECKEQHVAEFFKLPYKNKIFFTCKEWKISDDRMFKIHQLLQNDFITASHEPFGNSKYINVTETLNHL